MRSGFVVLCGLAVALTACSVKAVTYTPVSDQPDAQTSHPTEDCATPGDEDGNGLADCADPACASAPNCQPVCGNGKVEPGEQCDDGNTANGDECSSTCQNVSCTASLVPAMTSPTTPSGQVFTSGTFGTGSDAWQAFDRSTSTQWISALDQTPAQIGYQFADGPHEVKSYSLTFINGSLTTRAPRDWTFEGWDGAAWIVVDTRSGQTDWLGFEKRTFAVASPGVYAMYRLDITEDNDPRPDAPIIVVSIGELDLVGCP